MIVKGAPCDKSLCKTQKIILSAGCWISTSERNNWNFINIYSLLHYRKLRIFWKHLILQIRELTDVTPNNLSNFFASLNFSYRPLFTQKIHWKWIFPITSRVGLLNQFLLFWYIPSFGLQLLSLPASICVYPYVCVSTLSLSVWKLINCTS